MKKFFIHIILAALVFATAGQCVGGSGNGNGGETTFGTSMRNSYTMQATNRQIDSICVVDTLPNISEWITMSFKDYETNEMVTKKITSRFILCGDGESDVDESDVLLGTRVMLCAAHQAHAALRIIAGAE